MEIMALNRLGQILCRRWPPRRHCETGCPTGSSLPATASAKSRLGGVAGLLDMRDALDQRKADVVDVSLPPANST
ncbi:hypothetical protein SAMN05444158_4346 [Bradyrhizobium canariense]|uniref:Uncharacterized protein n=1 Tax=Bradyrhizobium canariense TaxID=255045 RepID=A0A1H1XK65_9BRAD|nr:hypothetical protein SAMN05444158_4346 [Bradyrhizobium canariense]